MFRLVVVALAVIGLFSLFGGAGIGALFLVPLGIFLVLAMLGVVGCGMMGRGRNVRRWQPSRRERAAEPDRSREERFEEWHRLAHARDEVDSWVDGMPDARQE